MLNAVEVGQVLIISTNSCTDLLHFITREINAYVFKQDSTVRLQAKQK